MNALTPEQFNKLPKWAQAHILDLDRRAATAERTLREFYDKQTPSNIFTQTWDSEQHKMLRYYLQSHKVSIERDGLKVDILIRQDDPGVDIAVSDESRLCNQVCFAPTGNNQVRILLKKDMR